MELNGFQENVNSLPERIPSPKIISMETFSIAVTKLAVCAVAALHFGFFYLERFLWTTPRGLKIFRLSPEQAKSSAVLAANQAAYNLLLGVGLLAGLFLEPAHQVAIHSYILSYIFIVGIYGAVTVSRRIFWIQSFPALVALGLVLFTA
jgi:putative membrane protein